MNSARLTFPAGPFSGRMGHHPTWLPVQAGRRWYPTGVSGPVPEGLPADCVLYRRPPASWDFHDLPVAQRPASPRLRPGCAALEETLRLEPALGRDVPAAPDCVQEFAGADRIRVGFWRVVGTGKR
jgi:hypothetical protein